MCGHVGVAGDLFNKHTSAFTDLLMMDAVRGIDGTGVCAVSPLGQPEVIRYPGEPVGLIDWKRYDKVVSTSKRVLMGHNRKMTLGGRNHENTHPFQFRYVVGAHNGTIPFAARSNLHNYTDFDTDSEALINTVNHYLVEGAAPEVAVKETLGLLDDGAWALVMYFPTTRELGLVRNKERPLYYVFDDENKVLMWASEVWMLHGAAHRNGIKLGSNPMLLAEDTLFLIPTPKKAGDTWDKPRRFKTPGKEKVTQSFTHGTSAASRTGTATTNVQRLPAPQYNKRVGFPNDNKNGHYKPPYKTPLGQIINKARFKDLVHLGGACCYCEVHTPTYGEEVLFLRSAPNGAPQYLCKNCIHDDEIMEIARAAR